MSKNWPHRPEGVSLVLEIFKTLVRLNIVDSVVNPQDWILWYRNVKVFEKRWRNEK